MLRFLALIILVCPFNIYADIFLSSPNISLNSQDQRVIELKIQNDNIKDGDVVLYEYKTLNLINENDIAYTLIEDFENYQTFKIILSESYQEDYFSFKIQIKDSYTKDIFIFLPSKLRNFYQEPVREKFKQNSNVNKSEQFSIKGNEELASEGEKFPEVFKGSDITTVWSMAKKIKGANDNISIYQIMWSIYLGNKEAFINDNINLIRKDIDISVPTINEIEDISYQFAKDSILNMNDTFAKGFSSATKSLLVLTAPTIIVEADQDKKIDQPEKDLSIVSFDETSDPEDFIKENTKEISLGIESNAVKELLDQVEESEPKNNSSFEIFDLIFISLISLASGALLALIFIQLRNIKNLKNQEYDFEEAKDDDSMLSGLPQGLSIENNRDQQQLDLAVTYFEMDDKDNAKKILSSILKNSDNDEIKNQANNILNKIDQQ